MMRKWGLDLLYDRGECKELWSEKFTKLLISQICQEKIGGEDENSLECLLGLFTRFTSNLNTVTEDLCVYIMDRIVYVAKHHKIFVVALEFLMRKSTFLQKPENVWKLIPLMVDHTYDGDIGIYTNIDSLYIQSLQQMMKSGIVIFLSTCTSEQVEMIFNVLVAYYLTLSNEFDWIEDVIATLRKNKRFRKMLESKMVQPLIGSTSDALKRIPLNHFLCPDVGSKIHAHSASEDISRIFTTLLDHSKSKYTRTRFAIHLYFHVHSVVNESE